MTPLVKEKPDLAAYRESLGVEFPKIVLELTEIIGKKLTAYVAGVKDGRTIDSWMTGASPYGDAEERLRFAYRVVKMLRTHDKPAVVQAWLQGLNPELEDRIPIVLLRKGKLDKEGREVLGAARAFVAGG